MPPSISRGFRDISLSFTKNPITNDIIPLQNEDAIKKSVMNLVRTKIGERFYNNLIGSDVTSLIFELDTTANISFLEDQIKTLIKNFEPRVIVTSVEIDNDFEGNDLEVTISYNIVGLALPEQNIRFILEPTRI